MERKVFLFEHEGGKVLGFDTGLDSRAFAQAKFAQFLTEPGLIVSLGGNAGAAGDASAVLTQWQASGVIEMQPTMVVWGPAFEGERLDMLIADADRDKALYAVSCWIKAILALNDDCTVPLWPCSALIKTAESPCKIFFAPQILVSRCLMDKEATRSIHGGWYVHPDLKFFCGAAFTAAAMLYRIFAGSPPFTATDEILLHEDIREGNFLPVRLAVPALDGHLASLRQNVLGPDKNKKAKILEKTDAENAAGKKILGEFLAALQPDGGAVQAASFYKPVSEAALVSAEREKAQYRKIKAASVKTRRFITRNTALLLGGLAAIAIAALVAYSIADSRSKLPTTAGLDPAGVIKCYYNAIGDLDHQLMEACVAGKAGKDDITMVVNFFVINKVRQAYEMGAVPMLVSAQTWQDNGGGQIESGVFGVTGLTITGGQSGGMADTDKVRCRVSYTLWVPAQMADDPADDPPLQPGAGTSAQDIGEAYRPPRSYQRTDFVTLTQIKGNWRITEIMRVSGE